MNHPVRLAFIGAALAIALGAGHLPAQAGTPAGRALVEKNNCLVCHGLAKGEKKMGPSYADIGARYAKDKAAPAKLAAKIKHGGAGAWGSIPMPPQPQLKDAEVKEIVSWILGQGGKPAAKPAGKK